MSEVDLRRLGLDILGDVWGERAYLGPGLSAAFKEYSDIDRRGRAFLTRLCFGTEEKLLFLDAVIDSYSKTPVKKLRPAMLGILRISVYQIYFMDSVPEHAIVNEAVKLVRKRGMSSLSGFANGVLRSVIRDGRDPESAIKRLLDAKRRDGESGFNNTNFEASIRYSIPGWIIELWERDYGRETCEEICRGFLKPSPITIWTNTDPIEIKRLDGGGAVEDMPGFYEGAFYVQDEASMQPVFMAGIRPGEKVLDVCASPGGKSLLAARHGAVVEARDISREKVKRIEENIIRMRMAPGEASADRPDDGRGSVAARVWDATVYDEKSHGAYDVVIADLPCSGLGVLSKKPEIRYRVKPEDIDALSGLQSRILDTVCAYLRPGGRLVFSTCTIDRRENDENVDRFLAAHPDFKLKTTCQLLPEAGGHDGFFTAVIWKI